MQFEVGAVFTGKVTGITKFGAFVEFEGGKVGMVHISEIAPTYVNEIRDHIQENQEVKVKVLSISEDGKIGLSIKKAMEEASPRAFSNNSSRPQRTGGHQRQGGREWQPKQQSSGGSMSFEDMMTKFKKSSDDKISDLKKHNDVKRGSANRKGQK